MVAAHQPNRNECGNSDSHRDVSPRVMRERQRTGFLARPLTATHVFPATATRMIRVGEETGTLDNQLEVTAHYYEGELAPALAIIDESVERAASTGLTFSSYGLELRVLQVIARGYAVGSPQSCERFIAQVNADVPWMKSLLIIGLDGRSTRPVFYEGTLNTRSASDWSTWPSTILPAHVVHQPCRHM